MELNSLLGQFKNNNEEYNKVQFVAKQTVRNALSDSRQLLKFALLSIIESLRSDPIKFNSLTHQISSTMRISKSTKIDYAGSGAATTPIPCHTLLIRVVMTKLLRKY